MTWSKDWIACVAVIWFMYGRASHLLIDIILLCVPIHLLVRCIKQEYARNRIYAAQSTTLYYEDCHGVIYSVVTQGWFNVVPASQTVGLHWNAVTCLLGYSVWSLHCWYFHKWSHKASMLFVTSLWWKNGAQLACGVWANMVVWLN